MTTAPGTEPSLALEDPEAFADLPVPSGSRGWTKVGDRLRRWGSNGNGNGNSYGNRNGAFHGRNHFSFDVPPTTVEEFQQLRKNIMAARSSRPPQMMLVVSSRHGEGATTTTALLGSTMAQGGRCLVIDANFRTPGLTNLFGGETRTGLCEALAEGGDGSDHVHPTDLPNLYFMPTGIGPMRVPYMFEGRSFDDLLSSLRKDFDTILIDGAPMEMYADSAYLAPRTDGVIVIIQAEATPVSAPAVSLRELEHVNAPILGAVLNRTQTYIPESLARLTNPQEVIEVAVIPNTEDRP
ncbi:MAG: CpsD/CapB family tyrosine-protein kinase [bacterium]